MPSPGTAIVAFQSAVCISLLTASALCAQESGEASIPDKIYRCDRAVPLFTNKASYNCEEYEPRGAVRVAPNGMMFLGPPPTAGPSDMTRSQVMPEPAVALEESHLCQLYDEWLTLNERTSGGFFYQTTAQAARWFTLSRIFSSIGAPVGRCGH
jgi:hypothetical protein